MDTSPHQFSTRHTLSSIKSKAKVFCPRNQKGKYHTPRYSRPPHDRKKTQDIIAIAHVLIAVHSYRGIKLLADIMSVEEAGVLDCFVAAKTGSTANALGL